MARIIFLIRYRFFIWAGTIPFLIGQIMAKKMENVFYIKNFLIGFFGIIFVFTAIEFLNEYFDGIVGTDRVFSIEYREIPKNYLIFGLFFLFLSFIISIYLSFTFDWKIFIFSLIGFISAFFYVGPPIKWAYMGLGEIFISLSYGPFLILGSYYLQTKKISFLPFLISILFFLLFFSIALLNEIPDFYQDRIIGKKNIVVRVGKIGSIKLLKFLSALSIIYIFLIIYFKKFPSYILLSLIPYIILFKKLIDIEKDIENVKIYKDAINAFILLYFSISFFISSVYL